MNKKSGKQTGLQRILSTLSPAQKTKTTTPHDSPRETRLSEASSFPVEEFEKKIRRLATRQDLVIASNLHVLNLARIKAEVGDRWPRLRKLIQMNVESIISKHISKKDEVLQRSELNYVIFFSNLSAEETNERLAEISREIVLKVFGSDALMQGFELETTAVNIEPDAFENEDSLESIFGQLDACPERRVFSHKEVAGTGSISTPQNDSDRKANDALSHAKQLIEVTRKLTAQVPNESKLDEFLSILNKLAPALNSAKNDLMDIDKNPSRFSSENNQIIQQHLHDLNKLWHAIDTKISEVEEKKAHGAPSSKGQTPIGLDVVEKIDDPDTYLEGARVSLKTLKNARFDYTPIWSIKQEVVTTYKCNLVLKGASVDQTINRLFIGHDQETALFFKELAMLRCVLSNIANFNSTSPRCAFNSEFHFSSLTSSRHQTHIANALNHLSSENKKYLFIELVGIGANTWPSQIAEIITFLKPRCGAIALRIPKGYKHVWELKSAGAYAIGYDIQHFRQDEAQVFNELDLLCELSEKTGVKAYLSGVNSLSLMTSAMGSGVDFLDGKVLPQDLPIGSRALSFGEICTNILKL